MRRRTSGDVAGRHKVYSLSTLVSSFSDPNDESQNDSSSLDEELDALEQAELWATIAAQGKL